MLSLPRGRTKRALSAGRIEVNKRELQKQIDLMEFREKILNQDTNEVLSDDEDNKIEIVEGDPNIESRDLPVLKHA